MPRTTQRFEEFGDLLFTLVNIARWLQINPEEALRAFNRKFVARFAAAERLAVAAGHRMRDLPVEAQDRYWHAGQAAGAGNVMRDCVLRNYWFLAPRRIQHAYPITGHAPPAWMARDLPALANIWITMGEAR